MTNRKFACDFNAMESGEMLRLDTDPAIAVYRVDDEFYATQATCSHMESCLTEGYLDDDVVECALHGATFSVRSGKALSLPATVPLRTFDISIEGGNVYVELPDDVSA